MTGLDPALVRYLVTNRDFCAPAVAAAVAATDLPSGARVLDAGTGARSPRSPWRPATPARCWGST